eukprot:12353152-Ditylum_brightwellii.AAC.1
MAFDTRQKVWAKQSGHHGYHRATIVMEINNGKAFLLRWRKQCWGNIIVCARNMRPLIASQGLT